MATRTTARPAAIDREQRAEVLRNAGDRCRRCGVENHATIYRFADKDGARYMVEDGHVFDAEDGSLLGIARLHEVDAGRFVKVALIVGRDDESGDESVLCQRCNALSHMPALRAAAQASHRSRRACGDLFEGQ